MLFDPAIFDAAIFDTVEASSIIAPAPIFIVTRDDTGTPYTFTSPIKDPDSIERPGMDWSGWLQEGDDLASHDVFADSENVIVDLFDEAAGVVSWRILGGKHGQNYIVTCRITTTGGLADDRSILYKVRNR